MRKSHEPTEAYKRETRKKKDLARGDLWIVRGRRRHDGKEDSSSQGGGEREGVTAARVRCGRRGRGRRREERGPGAHYLYPHADLKAPTQNVAFPLFFAL
jgi:hypothetical protein